MTLILSYYYMPETTLLKYLKFTYISDILTFINNNL